MATATKAKSSGSRRRTSKDRPAEPHLKELSGAEAKTDNSKLKTTRTSKPTAAVKSNGTAEAAANTKAKPEKSPTRARTAAKKPKRNGAGKRSSRKVESELHPAPPRRTKPGPVPGSPSTLARRAYRRPVTETDVRFDDGAVAPDSA